MYFATNPWDQSGSHPQIDHFDYFIKKIMLERTWRDDYLLQCVIHYYNSQPAIEGYRVTMVQIFVTSNLSIQICSIDTRDER